MQPASVQSEQGGKKKKKIIYEYKMHFPIEELIVVFFIVLKILTLDNISFEKRQKKKE